MPTYAYQCEACGHALDAFQKITDAPLIECPQCGKESLKRGFGGGSATFRFQGDGFYVNDYKKKSHASKDGSSCCPCSNNQGSCKKDQNK